MFARRRTAGRGPALATFLSLLAVTACEGEVGAPIEPSTFDDGGAPDPSDAGKPPSRDAGGEASPDAGGGEPDGGAPDAGPPDAGPPGDDVPLIVAQGHLGRTMVSCDDGRTWVANRSLDDATRCIDDVDCSHHPGSGQGLTFDGTWFYAAWGWGRGGNGVARSRNGVAWETVLEDTIAGGIAAGEGFVVLGDDQPLRSTDAGLTWGDPLDVDIDGSVRGMGRAGDRLVLYANGGGGEQLLLSSDDGASWWRPDAQPSGCGVSGPGGGAVEGDGVLVVTEGRGVACRSTDGGRSWARVDLPSQAKSQLVWDGGRFWLWGRGVALRSADGLRWDEVPTEPTSVRPGAVTLTPGGAFVASRDGFGDWYEDQVLYRSTDGIRWEELPDTAFVGSHPIRYFVPGWGPEPAACR